MLQTLKNVRAVTADARREYSSLPLEHATPILLTASRPDRDMRLTEMHSTFSQNRAHLSRLLKIQEDVDASVRLLSSYTTQLSYATASISALSPEILAVILDLACPDPDRTPWRDFDPWAALVLSHVCSKWRSTLFSAPRRWSVIPIATSPHRQMLLEFAARSNPLPVTIRLFSETGVPSRPICIPSPVSKRIDTVMIETPAHLSALEFDAGSFVIPDLDLGANSPSIAPNMKFVFDPSTDYRLCSSVVGLRCDSAVVAARDEHERLPFYRLTWLTLVRMTMKEVCSTLASIDAPYINTLWCSGLSRPFTFGTQSEEVKHSAKNMFAQLKGLHLTGEKEMLEVIAGIVRGVQGAMLRTLDLWLISSDGDDSWTNDLAAILTYATNAREITIAAAVSVISSALGVIASLDTNDLHYLHILLDRRETPTAQDLEVAHSALCRMLAGPRSPRLARLTIPPALVEVGDKAWLEARVDKLILS